MGLQGLFRPFAFRNIPHRANEPGGDPLLISDRSLNHLEPSRAGLPGGVLILDQAFARGHHLAVITPIPLGLQPRKKIQISLTDNFLFALPQQCTEGRVDGPVNQIPVFQYQEVGGG